MHTCPSALLLHRARVTFLCHRFYAALSGVSCSLTGRALVRPHRSPLLHTMPTLHPMDSGSIPVAHSTGQAAGSEALLGGGRGTGSSRCPGWWSPGCPTGTSEVARENIPQHVCTHTSCDPRVQCHDLGQETCSTLPLQRGQWSTAGQTPGALGVHTSLPQRHCKGTGLRGK